jgi:GNAT superfamily N-acetyltransferase
MSANFQLVHVLSKSRVEQLHALYQRQWWSQGRTLDDVRTMLANSSLVFAFVEPDSGRLVAFCRLLTDFAFRGTLHDVMVDEAFQRQGIGRRLMDAVISHPRLAAVKAIGLWCKPELVPLYRQYGFLPANEDYCWLQRGQLAE